MGLMLGVVFGGEEGSIEGEDAKRRFLPGESQGWRSLVGCRLWGHIELDTTEAT